MVLLKSVRLQQHFNSCFRSAVPAGEPAGKRQGRLTAEQKEGFINHSHSSKTAAPEANIEWELLPF